MIPLQVRSNPFAPRRYGELQKITERVYLFRNITNSSFVIGDKGVAVIDTQVNFPLAERLLECIRSVTDKPIRYAVNTHYHWDHTNGNELFKKEGAVIVASRLTKQFMAERQERQKGFLAGRGFELGEDPLLPEVTFEGEQTIDLGDMPLRLFFAGRAETDDATAVHLVHENILMSGDTIMTGSFPIFGQPVWDEGLEGTGRWIQTIRKLMSFGPVHIVPGHGPLAHEPEVERLLSIQEYFVREVGELVRKGWALEEVLRDLEPRLPKWITDIPVVWGTPRYAILRVYRSLTKKENDQEPGWQRFKPSALPPVSQGRLDQATGGKETANEFFQMAREAAEGGDKDLQLAVLRRGAELFPQSPEVLTACAEALVEASRAQDSVLEKGDFFQIARECWNRALAIEPHYLPALLGKGRYLTMMAYRGGDDPAAGMGLLQKILEAKPGGRLEAEAHFYLGMGFRRLGEESKAHSAFQNAIEFDPSFMPAHLAGQVY